MGMKLEKAALPQTYDAYVFDLYGTLVDIHTDESQAFVWEKLALFYGYYGAVYAPEELKERYGALVRGREQALKSELEAQARYAHEASPEIEITEVFLALFTEKGVEADPVLAVHAGQFFRVLSTDYVRAYAGTADMLAELKAQGKKIYLLSNAQRIFTEYEMHTIEIARYFDDILISSDFKTRKPDERFFQILLERHKLVPERTLFVGNDSNTDIAGAKRVAFHTYYVNSNISPAGDSAEDADYIVEDFGGWSRSDS
ncbi:MAG: HAD family hydrolase [Muribaculaceae bacterium]|nr:HAD family hydrolase [Roseburia sp.]MCM1432047.1 HAD family hydrolase [Muribaculaceae bacterium]MCM1493919.1 HAD family hydrolase [Muribaculaceae bacterium]